MRRATGSRPGTPSDFPRTLGNAFCLLPPEALSTGLLQKCRQLVELNRREIGRACTAREQLPSTNAERVAEMVGELREDLVQHGKHATLRAADLVDQSPPEAGQFPQLQYRVVRHVIRPRSPDPQQIRQHPSIPAVRLGASDASLAERVHLQRINDLDRDPALPQPPLQADPVMAAGLQCYRRRLGQGVKPLLEEADPASSMRKAQGGSNLMTLLVHETRLVLALPDVNPHRNHPPSIPPFPFWVTSLLAVGPSTELHEASTDLFVIGGSGRADHNLLIGSRSCSRGSILRLEARPSPMSSAAPTVGAPLYPVRQPGLGARA